MKVVKLGITAANEGEVVSGTITIQRKRNDSWSVEDVITVISGQPGADRTMVLDDTQRLVIEGTSNMQTVYDRGQNAAVRVPIEPTLKATPMSTDGDEGDTPKEKTAEGALSGAGFSDLQRQEQRDAAITAARQKVADAQKTKEAAQPQPNSAGLVEQTAPPKPNGPKVQL